MLRSVTLRSVCGVAALLSCVLTLSLLPPRGKPPSRPTLLSRKDLLQLETASQISQESNTFFKENARPEDLSSITAALKSAEAAAPADELPEEVQQATLKLSVSLKQAGATSPDAPDQGHTAIHAAQQSDVVSATQPQNESQQKLVDDHAALLQLITSPAFIAKHASAAHVKRSREQSGERASQGILIAAGKALRLANAYVTIGVLREHLQCDLPIELWYAGPEEVDDATKTHLEARYPGLVCIDATTVAQPEHHVHVADLRGYQLKVFALYATKFEEVLMLDCDSMPLVNPQHAFDSPEFRRNGSMFWPDLFGKGTERVPGVQPELYTLHGRQPPWTGREADFMWAESGQVLLDRVRHADVLEHIWHLNTHPDPVYQLAYGDKDTFLLGFMLANKTGQYFQVKEWTRLCLHEHPTGDLNKLEHVGIIHHDVTGLPAFLHRTSGGKMDPTSDAYFTVDYITVPLSPQRAFLVFDGAAETGNYRYPKTRFQDAHLNEGLSPSSPHDHDFKACLMSYADARTARADDSSCRDDGRDDLPVPVIHRDQLSDASQTGNDYIAPGLMASYRSFEELRAQMRQPHNTFLTAISWLR